MLDCSGPAPDWFTDIEKAGIVMEIEACLHSLYWIITLYN